MSGPGSTARVRPGRLALRWGLAALFLTAGVAHFTSTDVFVKIMPPYLPCHRELVLISGACEVALGALLLIPATSRLAAWGLIALLIAVFPANIHMYVSREKYPLPAFLLLLRLPAQGLLVLWAYACTGPMIPTLKASRSGGGE